ncbi:MAG: hypothetical protein CENE_01539 [Candidatus Celerinatantimonas neptuna]|nr:MAG: hypothetical protein CENE_01539 [Candidatus Celerinatantimonas neptuna]
MQVKQVFSIRGKIILLACLLTLSILGVAILVWVSLQHNTASAEIINVAGRQRMLTKKFATEQLYQAMQPRDQVTAQKLLLNKTEKLYTISLNALQHGGQTYTDLGMTKPITLPEYKSALNYLKQLKQVKQNWQSQIQAAQKMQQSKGQADFQDNVNRFLQLNHQAMAAMNKAVGMYTLHTNDETTNLIAEIELLALVMLIICIACSWWVILSISKPMDRLIRISKNISTGQLEPNKNLNELINSSETGSIALYLEQMRAKLQHSLADMQSSSYQVHMSADQVSKLSSEISNVNAEEQHQFRMMIDSSDGLTDASRRFGDIAQETAQIVTQCTEQSQIASDTVAENIETMQATTYETERASDVIQALSSTAESVYGIVDAIKTISEQTNLLALNAAIEAARAGEQGRGFAVVADEVRTLAARTGTSTNEIGKLIGELTDGVNNAVQSMKNVAEKVTLSREKSNHTEASIDAVRQLIIKVTESQEQISEQATIQHDQLNELRQRQTQLYETLDDSRQKSHASSIIADKLSEISQSINHNLERFELGVIKRDIGKASLEKRQHPRMKTGIHCELSQGQMRLEGLTEDLSLGGTQIITTDELKFNPQQPIHIKLHYEKDKSLALECHLVGSNRGANNRYQYHMKFQNISNNQHQILDTIFKNFGVNSTFTE